MIEWLVGIIFVVICFAGMGWQNVIANKRTRRYDKIIDENVASIETCAKRRKTTHAMTAHNTVSRSSSIV